MQVSAHWRKPRSRSRSAATAVTAALALTGAAALAVAAPSAASAAAPHALAGTVPTWATAKAALGAAPSTTAVPVEVYLSSRDAAGLAAYAAAVSNKSSPEYQHFLTPAQQNQLEAFLQSNGAYELSLNSEAYRAMGIETSVESGIGRDLFLRGGYTYLDAVVQRSFTNSDYTLLGPLPTYNGIPIGAYSPLQGARPFRRPPHTGFLGVTFSSSKITGVFNASFVSRSDDSDFLGGSAYGSNPDALLLPNRNLDFGYAGLDLGGSYQILGWLGIQAQADNLLSNQHMAPIGYPSLPMTFRAGLRVNWAARRIPGL